MRFNPFRSHRFRSGLAASVLLLASGASFAQQQINLTAGPVTATLPDGTSVPMWGYICDGVTGTAPSTGSQTCSALNPAAATATPNVTSNTIWSPVVITVPTGQNLTVSLTNSLSIPTSSATPPATPPNNIPTSLVIVGQLGGGLGSAATYKDSPVHAIQGATWPIAGDTNGATFTPPPQGKRVQSFATEVAIPAGATTSTTLLTWTAPRPGTYLIESGSHPSIQAPMGLYGILVVTDANTGTAYPGVKYAADVALLLSEIDPIQNKAVNDAASTPGFSETSARVLRESVSSVAPTLDANGKVINAGSGYLGGEAITFQPASACTLLPTAVVGQVDGNGAIVTVNVTNRGKGCTQVPTATATTHGSGHGTDALLTAALSLAGVMCSDGATACYPPAVNYTPLYYLINGVAFDKSNPLLSLVSTSPANGVNGNVLVRLVNAGLRMHVPSIVGSTTGTAAAPGLSLIAEDGNVLPGVPQVQSEVFMPAGKTNDVMVNAPAACTPVPPATTCTTSALPIYDRELSLSANAAWRDGGMLAYISVNGGQPPSAPALAQAQANPDRYDSVLPGRTLSVSDPSKGLIANDINIYGVKALTLPAKGKLTLKGDGTFTYEAGSTWTSPDSFTYCGNGATTGPACALVTFGLAAIEAATGIHVNNDSYTSNVATSLSIKSPGVLANDTDDAGYPLTVNGATIAAPLRMSLTGPGTGTVSVDPNGGFNATVSAAGTYTFAYGAQNSQGTVSASMATVTLTFPAPTGLAVTVVDGVDKTTTIGDYRWIIEEDRTFYVDPNCTKNPLPAGCPAATPQGAPAVFGTNFHTSHMPLVATGCTGPVSCESGQTVLGSPAVCDVGNGACRTDSTQQAPVDPGQVHLDPNKRYYISVLPGDAANPFNAGYGGAPDCSPAGRAAGSCGHGMGGAPIGKGQTSVMVLTQPTPNPPAKLSVFVFEDDYPLNGEHDASGGIDILATHEVGLGGFQITLFDQAGGTGDNTGQPTYDMFNMPLTNSLAGTIDPATGLDACPISPLVTGNVLKAAPGDCSANPTAKGCQKGIVGMIVTCPKYESDGMTLSPLAGQAVINNLYQGRYDVMATPGADRIARGEEWLQTNTLDGQKAHETFMRIGEPGYFQEYGPAGYHVSIGFANPKIINERRTNAQGTGMCNPAPRGGGFSCTNEVKGHVTTARMSRPPDERLYGSGTRDSFSFTQCYVSLGDPDGADFAFTKCDADGNYDFKGIPAGNWKLTFFDQWNDQIVDGISTPVGVSGTNTVVDLGEVAVHQWQANIYTSTFFDLNGDGVRQGTEPGLSLVATNIRFRDGSFSNFNNTDLSGNAGFNEIFPLFSWYVIETDTTRYKSTGVHVVYDSGGPTDRSSPGGTPCAGSTTNPCGSSTIGQNMANTYERNPLPANLSVPGAVYCAEGADCGSSSIASGPVPSSTANHSTGRIDPPFWFGSYGWQGFIGQNSFLEFGKKPFADHENGGIHGHVVYASTRPFDDPQLLLQLSWEPLVPHVRVNLYRQDFAPDGITPTLTLVDYTDTSSFDDWAQGFRSDGIPNMNCPGQSTSDLFIFSLRNQPQWLDFYNNGPGHTTALPNSSQFKCYDGMHNWNQLQPAPYDGMYSFPSVTGLDPRTGKPTGTHCTGCTTNPDASDPYRSGAPMLPPGKYVVEVVVPPGYELVKEEDKNILIGDNYIAPVTQQFAGLGNIFILPDQAEIAAFYNSYNALNPTTTMGVAPRHEGDTGSIEAFWPCVGAARVVPDYISLFPQSAEVAPFAGATRNLCDRKEVTLTDQSSVLAKFYVFTSTHVAAHYTGIITDDFTAEFDPFSPAFGEKFAPAYLPVSVKDWAGNEISRTYSDQWGAYNGLNYSTWEVNPPNPTGYGPTTMVLCMNDSGSGATPDRLFQQGYSQFCYHLPLMPGQTGYFDTPVVPNTAFSEGYNHPDCNYPDATPAISRVDGDGVGPWVSAAGNRLTITALPDQLVENHAYSGPSSTTAPFNQQKVTRHYGFGNTKGSVTIGGVSVPSASITTWNDTTIVLNVPGGAGGDVPLCTTQQQGQYGGSSARCGQLVITATNGKTSVDTVTVTIGGKPPTVLAAGQTIQSAVDAAAPGDLIIVPPGVYNELLLMWKPVRLQGVGAASTVVNGNTHPAGKLDPWRKQVVCLFGLTPDGRPNPSDTRCSAGWNAASGGPNFPTMIVDRVPAEGILGWDATVNGNLAEQLQEPSLMGAYEGAAITVLGKGVNIPAGAPDAWGSGAEAHFPNGTVLLTAADCTSGLGGSNPYPGNFYCNPSSIDGLSVTNSSQGGGGIFVHAWGHNIEIANNRVYNNLGSLAGGITIGQGEHIDLPLGGPGAVNLPPGSCESSPTPNLGLPYCYDKNVNVHHNAVTLNSSLGDELFSSTPAGAGGVTLGNGSDYYRFANNWVCGNLSAGDGGGVVHLGWSKQGTIERNVIVFNQSTSPTISTNGGGLLVMGAPDQDPPCSTDDQDCVSPPSTLVPTDGTGLGLVIDANLILGNSADSGSGGGLRLQHVNGADVLNFPNGSQQCSTLTSCNWNSVNVTNNIIANNVAGWDGGGVSLQDALAVNVVNNTIVSNDSTASSGVLFNSLFAPLASAPGTNCTTNNGSRSCAQVAGLVSVTNSPVLRANLPSSGFSCPPGHGTTGNNGSCRNYSVPLLQNDVFWQNRSFFIGVAPPNGTGPTGQQSTVTLYNAFGTTPAPSQASTGACPAASYWDIGVRGDTGPTNHSAGMLAPTYSVLTSTTGYGGANNIQANPSLLSQYCNGSRVPPENGGMGWQVPPGTNETNVPTPVFHLTPSAVVDEGNNWVNIRWGPLSLLHPVTGATLGNYSIAANSPAIDAGNSTAAPATDFFGNPRPMGNRFDIGAVEWPEITLSPTAFNFGNQNLQTTSAAKAFALSNPAIGVTATGITVSLTGPNATEYAVTGNTCGSSVAPGAQCTISVTFRPTQTGVRTATLTVTDSEGTQTASLSGTGVGVGSASLSPTSWSATATRGNTNGVVPAQIFRLTATSAVSGIGPPVLSGANAADWTIVSAFTNCGSTVTSLAAGAFCNVYLQFRPLFTEPANSLSATLSVTDSAGLHTAGLTGTATGSGLSSISPTSGRQGTTVAVTLTGTNLTAATGVNAGTGVTCTITGTTTATRLTASCVINAATASPPATVGAHSVTVSTSTGNSNAVTFTVNP